MIDSECAVSILAGNHSGQPKSGLPEEKDFLSPHFVNFEADEGGVEVWEPVSYGYGDVPFGSSFGVHDIVDTTRLI